MSRARSASVERGNGSRRPEPRGELSRAGPGPQRGTNAGGGAMQTKGRGYANERLTVRRAGRHGGGEAAWGCGTPALPAPVPLPRSRQEPQEPPESPEPAAREPRVRETPEDICLEATANAIALHPVRPLLAAGDVDGDVYL